MDVLWVSEHIMFVIRYTCNMYYKVTNNLISADLEIIRGGGAQLILSGWECMGMKANAY